MVTELFQCPECFRVYDGEEACCSEEAIILCSRLLVGRGDETYDPLCVLPTGHAGACSPALPRERSE